MAKTMVVMENKVRAQPFHCGQIIERILNDGMKIQNMTDEEMKSRSLLICAYIA